jgi:antitoxin ParD1/3/4
VRVRFDLCGWVDRSIRSMLELLAELELGNVANYDGRDSMLNISLPSQISDFIERQAIADGFSTPSDYVLALILREQERLTQKERVESLLIEGLDSGVAIEITDDLWSQKRTNLDLLRDRLKEGAIVRAERDFLLVQE